MALTSKRLIGAVIAIVLIIAGYFILTMPDTRTASEKLGDAIHDLDKGPDKAARQLEDRTPGQKLGDAVKDAGDDIKHSTSNPNPNPNP